MKKEKAIALLDYKILLLGNIRRDCIVEGSLSFNSRRYETEKTK